MSEGHTIKARQILDETNVKRLGHERRKEELLNSLLLSSKEEKHGKNYEISSKSCAKNGMDVWKSICVKPCDFQPFNKEIVLSSKMFLQSILILTALSLVLVIRISTFKKIYKKKLFYGHLRTYSTSVSQ